MRYRQCRSCSFWVAPAERFCNNCGTYRPYQSGHAHRSAWLLFTTVLGGVLGGSVFYRLLDNAFLLYGCLAGCVIGLAWGLGMFGEVAAILLDRRRSPSLQSSELQLTERLAEIERTRRQVQDLQRRLQAEDESSASAFLSPLLQKADAAAGRAARRYAGELAKLELIRWRNGLEPIVAPLPEGAGYSDHHARLDAIHAHRERGRRLLRKWSMARLGAADAGQEPVAQLRRWLASCDRIVERLHCRTGSAHPGSHRRGGTGPACGAPHRPRAQPVSGRRCGHAGTGRAGAGPVRPGPSSRQGTTGPRPAAPGLTTEPLCAARRSQDNANYETGQAGRG